jgi:hypothetical protein
LEGEKGEYQTRRQIREKKSEQKRVAIWPEEKSAIRNLSKTKERPAATGLFSRKH